MWDKPQLLRVFTLALLACTALLLSYGTMRYVLNLPVFRLRTISLAVAPQKVDVHQVNRLIRQAVGGSFFTVDLVKTRKAFEQLPWVRKVSVRRQFPWGLEIALEEHKPLAKWNETQLVNTYGEVFDGQQSEKLPEFRGEPNTSSQVTEMYEALNEQLAQINLAIQAISLTPRFSWQVQLDNGLVLELGREQVKQRMARFVAVYPYSIQASVKGQMLVDLRYRNGFAIRENAATAASKLKITVSRV